MPKNLAKWPRKKNKLDVYSFDSTEGVTASVDRPEDGWGSSTTDNNVSPPLPPKLGSDAYSDLGEVLGMASIGQVPLAQESAGASYSGLTVGHRVYQASGMPPAPQAQPDYVYTLDQPRRDPQKAGQWGDAYATGLRAAPVSHSPQPWVGNYTTTEAAQVAGEWGETYSTGTANQGRQAGWNREIYTTNDAHTNAIAPSKESHNDSTTTGTANQGRQAGWNREIYTTNDARTNAIAPSKESNNDSTGSFAKRNPKTIITLNGVACVGCFGAAAYLLSRSGNKANNDASGSDAHGRREAGAEDSETAIRVRRAFSAIVEKALADLRNNSITTLDLSSQNIGDEEAKELASTLKDNQALTKIKLDNNDISAVGAQAFAEALKTNKILDEISFLNNNIGNEGAKSLAETLKVSRTLTNIDFERCGISLEGVKALANALKVNSVFRRLQLENNNVGDEGAKVLAEALKINKVLTQVHLYNARVGNEGAIALSEALKVNRVLAANLDMGSNLISDIGAKALSEALKVSEGIYRLSLNKSLKIITSESIQVLAEALKLNRSLKIIRLDENQIDNVGAQALITALKDNYSVSTLNLDGNPIDKTYIDQINALLVRNVKVTDAIVALKANSITSINLENLQITASGAKLIAEALKENTSLESLHLHTNQFGYESAVAIADALKINKVLTYLDLNNNEIGAEGTKVLADSLKENNALQTLLIAKNQIGVSGIKAIADVLKINTNISVLNVMYNSIGDEGGKALAEALKVNRVLEVLSLAHNPIGDVGASALADAIKVNQVLRYITLYDIIISKTGIQLFADALKYNHALAEFFISANDFDIEGMRIMAATLKVNVALVEVGFRNTSFLDDISALVLINALQDNYSIISIDIRQSILSESVLQKINALLERNKQYPSFTNNHILIEEGETIAVTSEMLKATAPSEKPVTFNVTKSDHGHFIDASSKAITAFSQTQIDDGEVRFTHDGSENNPSYSISASDGTLTTPAHQGVILFEYLDDAPKPQHNEITVWPNTPRRIMTESLSALDPDTIDSKIQFNITHINNAAFKGANTNAITSFFQNEIIAGNIAFAPQGDLTPSFNFTINDGTTTVGPFKATINFNPQGVDFVSPITLSNVDGKNGFEIHGEKSGVGWALGGKGDFNCDGIDDILMSSRDSGGNVYVIWGSKELNDGKKTLQLTDLRSPVGFKIPSYSRGSWFGDFINVVPDINNDGCDELACPTTSVTPILYGSKALTKKDQIDLEDIDLSTGFFASERARSRVGDVNGDGELDLILCNAFNKVYVITQLQKALSGVGSPEFDLTLLKSDEGFEIYGPPPEAIGDGIADVNGDTFDDFLICAPYKLGEAGMCYVLFGSFSPPNENILNNGLDNLDGRLGFKIPGLSSKHWLGSGHHANQMLGDINGDGYTDFSVMDLVAEKLYVIFGDRLVGQSGAIDISNFDKSKEGFVIYTTDGSSRAGSALGSADVNGDGLSDILLGSAGQSTKVYVLFGHPKIGETGSVDVSRLNGKDGIILHGPLSSPYPVGSGDYNADGVYDLTIGVPAASPPGKSGAGIVYAIYGASDKTFAIKQAPVIVERLKSLTITPNHVNTTCLHYGPGKVTIIPEDMQYGKFELKSNPGVALTEFTQQQINNAEVVLQSTHNTNVPEFTLKAKAGFWMTKPQSATIAFLDLPPKLHRNEMVIWKNEVRKFTTALLSATDVDTEFSKLQFDIASIDNGVFFGSQNKTITSFTQEQIIAGDISFVARGELAPTFNFTISDGTTTIGPFKAKVNFNPQGVDFVSPITLSNVDGKNGFEIKGEGKGGGVGWSLGGGVPGDFNGDGIHDIAMTYRMSSGGGAYVIWGSKQLNQAQKKLQLSGLRSPEGFKIPTYSRGSWFGDFMYVLPDITGNGCDELAFRTWSVHPILYGSSALTKLDQFDLANIDLSTGILIDQDVYSSTAGNFDGDNANDLILDYPNSDTIQIITKFRELKSRLDSPEFNPSSLLTGESFEIYLQTSGFRAKGVGDINGDMFDDLLSCADKKGAGGICYVFFGSPHPNPTIINNQFDHLDGQLGFKILGMPGALLGSTANKTPILGDINGDGYRDFAVTSETLTYKLGASEGILYVIFGGPNLGKTGVIDLAKFVSNQEGFIIYTTDGTVNIGSQLSSADVNGDGLDDILLNAFTGDTDKIYVLFGNRNLRSLESIDASKLNGNNGVVFNGVSSSGSPISTGDFNADGVFDISIGQPEGDVVHIIYGASENTFSIKQTPIIIDRLTSLMVTPEHIKAICLHYGPENITIVPEGMQYGQFELKSNPGVAVTDFTQQQIINGEIILQSTHNTNVPEFTLKAKAGFWMTKPQAATVVFNTPPQLLNNQFTIREGESLLLNQSHLNATDKETSTDELQFTISIVKHGAFHSSATHHTVNDFLQSNLSAGDISLVSDNSGLAPVFNVSVSDGTYIDGPKPAEVAFVKKTTSTSTMTSTSATVPITTSTSSKLVNTSAKATSNRSTTASTTSTTIATTSKGATTSVPTTTINTNGTDTSSSSTSRIASIATSSTSLFTSTKPTSTVDTAALTTTNAPEGNQQPLTADISKTNTGEMIAGILLLLSGIGFLASTIYLGLRYLGDLRAEAALKHQEDDSKYYPMLKRTCEVLFESINTRTYGYISEAYAEAYKAAIKQVLGNLFDNYPQFNFNALNASQQTAWIQAIIAATRGSLRLDGGICSSRNVSRLFVAEVTPQQIRLHAAIIAKKVIHQMSQTFAPVADAAYEYVASVSSNSALRETTFMANEGYAPSGSTGEYDTVAATYELTSHAGGYNSEPDDYVEPDDALRRDEYLIVEDENSSSRRPQQLGSRA